MGTKLFGREKEQFVYVNNLSSSRGKLLCGVPQGSILGPLLFLIYINDLRVVCKNVMPLMFADDTCLLLSHSNIDTLIREANEELQNISKWFKVNQLSLNIEKTNFMIFSTKNKGDCQDIEVSIDGLKISQVNQIKFLGVIVDQKLTWKYHIQHVCRKIMKSVGILSRVRSLIDISCMKTLYYSLIYPHILYCNIVWGATCQTYLNKILLIQKKFLRIMSNSNRSSSSAPLFIKYNILTIFNVNIYCINIFMYKYVNMINIMPRAFNNFFMYSSDVHAYSTRRCKDFYLPFCRTTANQSTLKYRGPSLWNHLDPTLKTKTTLNSFKRELKIMLTCK